MQALIRHISETDLSQGLSVYVHIPFCRHKCYFCDFFSVQNWPESRRNRIVSNILEQLHGFLARLNTKKIATFYLGGGTPSLLAPNELAQFLEIAVQYDAQEITAEASPEGLEKEWVQTLFSYPYTRISMGIQSFLTDQLALLGRIVSRDEILRSLELLAPYHQNVNLDLLAGLKGQNSHVLKEELTRLTDFNPGHISFYMLTLEEGTPLFRRKHLIPDEEIRSRFWLEGRDFLYKKGYIDYEISNFTKSRPARHNQRYWQLHPYIGIGPGAVSNFPLKGGRALRLQGITKLSLWEDLESEQTLYNEEIIEAEDFLFEHFMMGWRTRRGVDTEILLQRFGDRGVRLMTEAEMLMPIKRNHTCRYFEDDARLNLNRYLIQIMELQEKLNS